METVLAAGRARLPDDDKSRARRHLSVSLCLWAALWREFVIAQNRVCARLHALNGKSRHHQKRAQIHGSGVIDFTVTNF
jgi:hypothetical protein